MISDGSSVFALQVTSSNFNTSNYYQGDNGNIAVTLYNDNSLVEWHIKTVEIQFDWMIQSQTYWQTPVNQVIASGGSATYSVPFSIPTATSVGWHTYTVSYIGLFDDSHVLKTGTIYIHDVNERIYYNLQQEVKNDINSAANSGFQSPDAESDLSQARSDFSLASNYASNGQFVNGISELQSARNLITQANSAEQLYRSSHSSFGGGSSGNSYGGSSNNNYSDYSYSGIVLLAIIAVGIVGSLGFILLRIKKKSKVSKSQYTKPSSDKSESPISNTKSEKMKYKKNPIENMPESTNDVKNVIIEESTEKTPPPKIEDSYVKTVKPRKKNTKTTLEKEHDAKALSILKERLARGNISKEEYSKLKEEFE